MNKPLIAIVGVTASGKSGLGIRLAEKFNGEIISADSWAIRRYTDIGTAKPSLLDQQRVPHHLIDIIDPDEDFSAAIYKREANRTIDAVSNRGHIAFLVGGSGLYIDSILYDFSFLPPADPEIRDRLNEMTLYQLHELAISHGLSLSGIDSRNKRRVIRLIETKGAVASKQELRANSLIIGLLPTKEQIDLQIENRVKEMFRLGLKDEIERLYNKYGWDSEGMKGIGYFEWKLYFEGNQSLDETKQRIIKDTLMLAKRQGTWFRKNKSIHWYPTPVNYPQVEELVTTYLNKNISL